MRGYILIETNVGKATEVVKALQDLKSKEIKSVDLITGPYDAIAIVEYEDMDVIGRMITDVVHKIPGIQRTVTCFSIRI